VNVAVKTGEVFRQEMQFAFFMHYLKGTPLPTSFTKAQMFATGVNEFRRHEQWPPKAVTPLTVRVAAGGRLVTDAAVGKTYDEYVSDPNKPVPYVGYIAGGMTGDYMTEDQRFAAQRPDVLVYTSPVLDEDLTVAGPIGVKLSVSTSGTDSDFVVKVIDVYPGDYPQPEWPAPTPGQPPIPRPANYVRMGGYEQLVRGEPFRAKFRKSFEKPEAMSPGERTAIDFDLPDVYHVFRRGHRVMVQIQSSWFPLVDRNPQQFIEIPKAKREDFRKATQRVYHGTSLTLPVESGAWPK
jgi:putative CocE/NonD family hydrolase